MRRGSEARSAQGPGAVAAPGCLQLVAPSGVPLAPGEQVAISYGNDKGNEELLLLYGARPPGRRALPRTWAVGPRCGCWAAGARGRQSGGGRAATAV